MSEYANPELFFDPKTKQYGSHMIMSNVHKTSKNKYVNIDTRFRDEYNYSQLANYNITIPERISDVKSMKVVAAEIPVSFYNISLALGNSFFSIKDGATSATIIIKIPDGQYSSTTLINAINNQISTNYYTGTPSTPNLEYSLRGSIGGYDANGTSSYFITKNSKAMTINYAINSDGSFDKFNVKSKLGWLLGFRQPSYILTATSPTNSILSEALVDVNGPRYLYLAIDEFNKGNQSSFIPPLYSSLVNKNIIARIPLIKSGTGGYLFGQTISLNNYTGLLSDLRSYTGKIDLLKLNVQLLNENGIVMNLNGMDFSFCLEIVHE